jgi:hypothetical protein
MHELFAEVMDLQKQFSDQNTAAMMQRGLIIRRDIPAWLTEHLRPISKNLGPYLSDLVVQGRDGTGRKTLVPWVRLYSAGRSPSAQTGWYVVYLFHPSGEAVSLCLMHGSTVWTGAEFKPRTADEARALLDWSRAIVGPSAQALGFDFGVRLGNAGRLAAAYESTTALSRTYLRHQLPSADDLLHDLTKSLRLLEQLYHHLDLGRDPGAPAPEIVDAIAAVEVLARPRSRTGQGQGFGLTAPQRQAVDRQAMTVAEEWLKQHFDSVQDVHTADSCDFRVQNGDQSVVVEVKGTTGGAASILLTINEVELHRASYPHNILMIVHSIDLDRKADVATGGTLLPLQPWRIDEECLRPTGYQYHFR